MDTDRNLLFGVLCLPTELIDSRQVVDACGAWAARKDSQLAAILSERGWITPSDQADVQKLLERKLKRFDGDVRASLATLVDEQVREAVEQVSDSDVRRSISTLLPAVGHRRGVHTG